MKCNKAQLEAWLTAVWYTNQPVNPVAQLLLHGLSLIYQLARFVTRQATQIRQAKQATKPVVLVVGNLIAGGAGKTPIVCAICQTLQQRGFQVGILSRGYQRKSQKLLIIPPHTTPDPAQCGDEPAWLAQETNCPIAVGANRKQALQQLTHQYPNLDFIVCDDGLQHGQLPRSIEWVVFDARGAGNRKQLPAGPLREPLSRLNEVDAILLNNLTGQQLAAQLQLPLNHTPVYEVSLHLTGFINQSTRELLTISEALKRFSNQPVIAFTGLAYPDKFFKLLKTNGFALGQQIALPDHYDYPNNYHDTLDAEIALTTGKDAVKLSHCAKNVWVACFKLSLPEKLIEQLIQHLQQPVGSQSGRTNC